MFPCSAERLEPWLERSRRAEADKPAPPPFANGRSQRISMGLGVGRRPGAAKRLAAQGLAACDEAAFATVEVAIRIEHGAQTVSYSNFTSTPKTLS